MTQGLFLPVYPKKTESHEPGHHNTAAKLSCGGCIFKSIEEYCTALDIVWKQDQRGGSPSFLLYINSV